MLRNKLSFILASSLCLAFAGCDDDDGDTGAGATESGTTDATTTDTPTTDTPTTDEPTTTSDDSSTTDDTSDDSSTTDDTTADPCDDVECDAGEACVGGICVEDVGETEGETEGGGDGDPNYPNPAGECPDGHLDGSTAIMPSANYCLAPCENDMCPGGATGTAVGFCGLVTEMPSGTACKVVGEACQVEGETCQMFTGGVLQCSPSPSHCFLICEAGGMTFDCPDGMSCQVDNGQGQCVYP